MTRKEQIEQEAMKRFPHFGSDRIKFIQGAEWADESMIQKACEWLLKNIHNYLHVTGGGYWFDEGVVLDLRKAMEE